MASRTVSVKVVGDATSARRELGSVADSADKVGARAGKAFGVLTSMAGQSGMFGPLAEGLEVASKAFEKVEGKGKQAGAALLGAGAAATAAGVFMTSASAKDVQAHNQLVQAIEASGHAYGPLRDEIEKTVKEQQNLGHQDDETSNALRRLTQATGDPTKAMREMGVVADLAANQHISLEQASVAVTKILAGSGARTLAQYGIVLDKTKSKTEGGTVALDQLAVKLKGQAAASVDSFAGRLDIMKTKLEDSANAVFAKLGPALTVAGPLLMGVGAIMETVMSVKAALAARAVQKLAASQAAATATAAEMAAAETANAVALDAAAVAGERAGTRLGGALGGITKAAAAVGGAYIGWQVAKAYQDQLLSGGPDLNTYTKELLALGNASTTKLTGDLAGLDKAVSRVISPSNAGKMANFVGKITLMGSFDLKHAQAEIDDLDKALAGLVSSGHADDARSILDKVTAGMDPKKAAALVGMLNDYKGATDAAGNAATLAAPGSGRNADAIAKAAKAADAAKKALQGYGGQLDVLNGKSITAEESTIAFKQGLQDLPKALAPDVLWLQRHGRVLDDNTDAGRRVTTGLLDLSKKSAAHAVAVATETGKVEDGNRAMLRDRDALLANLRAHGLLTPAVQALVDKYYRINPATLAAAAAARAHAQRVHDLQHEIDLLKPKTVGVNQKGAEAARQRIRELQGEIDHLTGKDVRVNANGSVTINGHTISAGLEAKILRFADGGRVPMLPGATAGRDSVAAMLTPNEFIVRADGSNLGEAFAHFAKGYAQGGRVSSWPSVDRFPQSFVNATASGIGAGMVGGVKALAAAAVKAALVGSGSSELAYARSFIGTPYLWGGAEPGGFDCSGFTSYVMKHFGMHPPRTAAEQQRWATPESGSTASPGDLVFYGRPAHHVGIYEGNGRMIDSPTSGSFVREENVWGGATYGRPIGLPGPAGLGAGGTGGYRGLGRSIANDMGVGSQFGSVDYIFTRESGWNPNAKNPTSSAYGIPQFLDSTWGPFGGKTSNPSQQIRDGIMYMISRYGSPNAAASFWQGHHWYDQGGWLMPGTTIAHNNTGRPERIVKAGEGGTVININVSVPVSANPVQVGKEIQKVLVGLKRSNGGAALGLS